MDSTGKVIAITGGGSGIGAAVARRYAAEGARVVVLGRRPEPLEEVAAGTGAHVITCDASVREQVENAIAEIIDRFGRLDVAVANAGGAVLASVTDTDDEAWDFAMRSNLSSAFVFCRAALPSLIETRGQVVVVSSLAGLFAGPNSASYVTAKHALVGLTRSIARDFGPKGVRANAVCPGWVRTPLADRGMDALAEASGIAGGRAEAYRTATAEVPLRRAAEPAEIASIVRFLGSAESSYITGAVIVADGGAHAVDLPTLAFERAGL
ncbi:SDR family NAD(P)-dependent oxidoreductase [Kibdelosporangium phytohabitans]|uniref:3-oxoacyl-ACP reductase n=1 Tax=Kibdelosporangium phytohabitans TaxID=860235 RepID=A0A0N9I4M8_9PSEU|nr:SDR family oxidoreductase [Kibdelosporangium phytohabitans]ALG10582.1 3-oxoacyl-ACP reductase [Kibdelosporangium phytohabitans]MBE1461687.1 NAD(P)-dependent dehydrogenase (short-subunit alcohol dehydrogenase family) [Kibdelosporangium phytohabitans]